MSSLGDYMRAANLTETAARQAGDVWYSEPEINLADALAGRGWRYEQQKRVARGATTAVLDFFVEDAVAVEIDGKDFHDAEPDRRRDLDLLAEHGFHTLRVSGWIVMRHIEEVVPWIALRLSEIRTGGWPTKRHLS